MLRFAQRGRTSRNAHRYGAALTRRAASFRLVRNLSPPSCRAREKDGATFSADRYGMRISSPSIDVAYCNGDDWRIRRRYRILMGHLLDESRSGAAYPLALSGENVLLRDWGRPHREWNPKKVTNAVDVYKYVEHVDYLQAWFRINGRQNGHVSHRTVARRLGRPSSSYLCAVINGKSGVSDRLIRDLPLQLGLLCAEAKYFRVMCYLARSEMDCALKREVLRKFRPLKGQGR